MWLLCLYIYTVHSPISQSWCLSKFKTPDFLPSISTSLSLSLSLNCSQYWKGSWYFSKQKKRIYRTFFLDRLHKQLHNWTHRCKSRLQREFLKVCIYALESIYSCLFFLSFNRFRGVSFLTLNKIFSIFDKLGHEMLYKKKRHLFDRGKVWPCYFKSSVKKEI